MYEFVALKKVGAVESNEIWKIELKIDIESLTGGKALPLHPNVIKGEGIPWYENPRDIFEFSIFHYNISILRRKYPFIIILTNDRVIKLGTHFDHRFATGNLDENVASKYKFIKLNNIEYTRMGELFKGPDFSSILFDIGTGDLMDFAGGLLETMLPFSYILLLSKTRKNIQNMKALFETPIDANQFEEIMLEFCEVITYFIETPDIQIITKDNNILESLS